MARSLKFRHRIGLLVVVAALGLVTMTIVTMLLGHRAEREFSEVELRYVPLLELDRDLKTLFDAIPRALEAAVASAEVGGIAQADADAEQFVLKLRAGAQSIADNGGDASALADEFHAYYANAHDVSAALAGGTPAEQLGPKIDAMARAQQAVALHLEAATTPDRTRLGAAFSAARETQRTTILLDIAAASIALLVMVLLSWRVIRRTVAALGEVASGMERLARGEFAQEIRVTSDDELGDLAHEANRTAIRLRDYRAAGEREDWIKTGLAGLSDQLAGDLDQATLGRRALTHLATYAGAEVAVAYVGDEAGTFHLLASHGVTDAAAVPATFQPGENVVGQAVRDGLVRVLASLPPEYLRVRSALGETSPRCVVIVPFAHEGRAMGVLELGLLAEPSERVKELLQRARTALAIAFQVAEARHRTQQLLDETQRQAEELRGAYETVETRNQTLVSSRQELRQANEDLARASRYKSEFLANMSHELRTPLNSIMILSKILADNEEKTLADRQVEFATLIHKSGEELLTLINDVLDMAKVEAGKQDLTCEQVKLAELFGYVRKSFEPIAGQRQLAWEVVLDGNLPGEIRTDRNRLSQILKNLIANAFKFTEHGKVTLHVSRYSPAEARPMLGLPADLGDAVAIEVTDTGVGIAADKQAWVFEAFAQADGGTSRKYGGTGLGLTIARQLAMRLGGNLDVTSALGKGSTFRIVVPVAGPVADPAAVVDPPTGPVQVVVPRLEAQATTPLAPMPVLPPVALGVADDRASLTRGDACVLVIEDDAAFARVVLELIHEAGFKALVATDGKTGLELARQFVPSGVILDVGLPDFDGWSVMEALKGQHATRDIPVHFVTAAEDAERAQRMGAVGFASKPVDAGQLRSALHAIGHAARAGVRRVLLVEHVPAARASLQALLGGGELEIEAVATPREALARLTSTQFGCVVAALELPDKAAGLAFVAQVRADEHMATVPIVLHTGLALAPEELRALEAAPHTIVVRDGERSLERVLEETRVFVHRVRTELPKQRARVTAAPAGRDAALDGKTVLIADDDMRNVYSLASALRAKHLKIVTAADGQEALDELAQHPETNAVLMDVMMPRMDGHEATRRIRAAGHDRLPIIALTAKTMAGEREKCLAAGANDYMPKPIDVDRLLALLRVWLA